MTVKVKSFPAGTPIEEVFKAIDQISFDAYMDMVFEYCEYLGVPDYVVHYEPFSVSNSFARFITTSYKLSVSYRMCAISLFSLTLNKIGNEVKKGVIN